MKTINYCIVVPENVNIHAERGTEKWYELYDIISKLLKDTVYNDGVPRDICGRDLCWEDNNLIFQYKAVPATAPTMSSYPYYHALIIKENSLVK
jgi:hypothetical protein